MTKKISELNASTGASGTDEVEANDSGTSVRLTLTQIKTFFKDVVETLTGKTITFGANTVSGTAAEFDTAVTDDNIAYEGQSNSWTDGIKQTFNPDGTTPGINFGSNAGDPSTPADGDVWYNSSTNKFRGRQAAANVDLVGGGGAVTWTDVIPCVLEIAEGVEAVPTMHALATQVSTVSGFLLPTATDSTINFKWICPEDLAGTPALVIRVHTVTLSANTTDAINLTLRQKFTGDTENTDTAFVAGNGVAATNYNVSDTIESHDFHDITPTNSPTAGELVTGQIFRDISADVAGDVLIVGISAHIDRTTS